MGKISLGVICIDRMPSLDHQAYLHSIRTDHFAFDIENSARRQPYLHHHLRFAHPLIRVWGDKPFIRPLELSGPTMLRNMGVDSIRWQERRAVSTIDIEDSPC